MVSRSLLPSHLILFFVNSRDLNISSSVVPHLTLLWKWPNRLDHSFLIFEWKLDLAYLQLTRFVTIQFGWSTHAWNTRYKALHNTGVRANKGSDSEVETKHTFPYPQLKEIPFEAYDLHVLLFIARFSAILVWYNVTFLCFAATHLIRVIPIIFFCSYNIYSPYIHIDTHTFGSIICLATSLRSFIFGYFVSFSLPQEPSPVYRWGITVKVKTPQGLLHPQRVEAPNPSKVSNRMLKPFLVS